MLSLLYANTLDYEGNNVLYQRPQHICRILAQRGWEIHYVNHTQIEGLRPEKVMDNLTIWHNWNVAKKRIKKVDIHLISWSPRHIDVGEVEAKAIVYDDVDNFSQWDEYLTPMLEKSDIVFTASQPIYELRRNQHANVHLLRNACDYKLMWEQNDNVPDEYLEIRKNRKPILLFSGAIASWVDLKLLETVSKIYNLVVIGMPLNTTLPKKCFFLGKKDYKDTFRYIKFADICILPFDNSNVSYYSCPIKIFEYMAAGKLTVSNNIPEAGYYPNIVLPSKTHDEFIHNIDRSLRIKDREEIINTIKKCALENTWQKRVDIFEYVVKSYIAQA